MRYSVELVINVEAEDYEAAFMKAVDEVAKASLIGPEAYLGYVIKEQETGNLIEGMAYAPGMESTTAKLHNGWRMPILGVEG